MRPIPPSLNCQHQANTAYDKLAVISENIDKLREIEQFIFELKQWLRAYIDKVRASISAENFANLTENNVFTGINTFADVYLNNGNIYWKDEYNNDIAWIKYDKEHQILTLHVRDSELSLSPNLAITGPTNADVDNSIVTYAFLHGLLQELENRVTITVDNTVIDGSNNPPSGNAVYDFVMANQLVLDDTVTQNSSNGVKSSGIYAALQELDNNLRTLISALDDRISAINTESSKQDIYCIDESYEFRDSDVGEYILENGTLYAVYKVTNNVKSFNYDNIQLQVSDLDKCGYQKGYLYLNGEVFYTSRIIKPTADIRARGVSTSTSNPHNQAPVTNGYGIAPLKKIAAQDVDGVHLVGY